MDPGAGPPSGTLALLGPSGQGLGRRGGGCSCPCHCVRVGAAQTDSAQLGGRESQQHLELLPAEQCPGSSGSRLQKVGMLPSKRKCRDTSLHRGEMRPGGPGFCLHLLRRPTSRTWHLPQGHVGALRSAGWGGVATTQQGDCPGRRLLAL